MSNKETINFLQKSYESERKKYAYEILDLAMSKY